MVNGRFWSSRKNTNYWKGRRTLFKKIMVPLDGSTLAECALDYAETLAQSCQSTEVVLVSVTERILGRTKSPESKELLQSSESPRVGGGLPEFGSRAILLNPQGSTAVLGAGSGSGVMADGSKGTAVIIGKLEKQAYNYLKKVARRFKAKNIPVKYEVLIGDPAEQITKYAEESDIEVIVMASHGRSGPSRWALGSVSDKVFRASCKPILLVRAPGCFPGV